MGPSMALEGATTKEVFDKEVFEAYVEHFYVEHFLARALGPGQLVVMDNLGGAHRPKRESKGGADRR